MTRTARALALIALAAPLAGAAVLTAATPAVAGGGITSPGGGTDFTSDTTVRIAASISGTTRVELKLKSPVAGSTAQTVASGQGTLTNSNATLTYDLDTSCATYPSSSCSGRAPAPNGVWTVSLSGGATDSRTFTLRIPPRTPTGLSASPSGARAVAVSWRKGDEPDLTGWTLYGDGGVVQDGIGTDACSAASCSTTVTYASDGTGTHTYSLTSHRSVAPGSSDTLESVKSAEASATLGAASPSPAAGSGSGSGSGSSAGGGSGGTGSGSTGGASASGSGSSPSASAASSTGGAGKPSAAIVAQRRQFALTFQAFAPQLGLPKPPPLPVPAQPAVAPLPDGTYETTLGYHPVVTREKVQPAEAVSARVTGAVGSALDSEQFLRTVAGGLVLLLVAAHLRRWLGSHQE